MKFIQVLFLIGVVCIFTPLILNLGGISLRLSYIFFALCGFLLILSRTPLVIEKSFIYYFLFIAFGVLNEAIQNGLNSQLLITLVKIPILFVIYNIALSGNYLKHLIISLFILILFVLIYHWYQGFLIYYKLIGESKVLFGLIPILIYSIKNSNIFWQFLYYLSISIMIVSGERKAIAAFFLSLIRPSSKNLMILVFFGIPIIVFLAFFIFDTWLEQAQYLLNLESISNLNDLSVSNKSRLIQLVYSFELIKSNLIFGSGLTASLDLFSQEVGGISLGDGGLHNTYLSVLVNGGLVGAAFFLGWLISLYKLVKNKSNSSYNAMRLMRYALIVIFFTPYSFLSEAILMMPLIASIGMKKISMKLN